ncbi:hypothetical protein N7534_005600 [Penicillium rubens]|nr:hypothetical protein N7534_005600 [Penicillium rubens]
MSTRDEIYVQPPIRQARIEIKSLLNSPTEDRDNRSLPSAQRAGTTSPSLFPCPRLPVNYVPVSHLPPVRYTSGTEGHWRWRHLEYPGKSIGAAPMVPRDAHMSSTSMDNPKTQRNLHNFGSYRFSESACSVRRPWLSRKGLGWPPRSVHNDKTERRRPPRPKYDEEEMYFIWYHRVNLNQQWKVVQESFNRQFPSRQRGSFQGLQCKFYRFIKAKKGPAPRGQHHMDSSSFLHGGTAFSRSFPSPQFGVVKSTKVWYPWMRGNCDEIVRD